MQRRSAVRYRDRRAEQTGNTVGALPYGGLDEGGGQLD
jgi:hypothetical protein